jgi:diacylglycerol kinase (ATP)
MQKLFADFGISLNVIKSRKNGDIETRVATCVNEGARQIIVAGGDGSIHEAVNGLLVANGSSSLGVVPTGTGNDFAKACGLPLDWDQATRELAQRIATGVPTRPIDIGRMNDRFFANGLGIGFDAKVTRVARSYRWPIGDVVYLLAILRCLYDGVATPELGIDTGTAANGFPWRGPVTLVSISNGAWVGGMFHIAPMADNADGELDLLIAAPVSRPRILTLLPKLMRGRHMQEAEIRHQAVQSIVITASSPVESHLDGEVQPLLREFEISVCPAALNLL